MRTEAIALQRQNALLQLAHERQVLPACPALRECPDDKGRVRQKEQILAPVPKRQLSRGLLLVEKVQSQVDSAQLSQIVGAHVDRQFAANWDMRQRKFSAALFAGSVRLRVGAGKMDDSSAASGARVAKRAAIRNQDDRVLVSSCQELCCCIAGKCRLLLRPLARTAKAH